MPKRLEPENGVTYIGARSFMAGFGVLCAIFGGIVYAAPAMLDRYETPVPVIAVDAPATTATTAVNPMPAMPAMGFNPVPAATATAVNPVPAATAAVNPKLAAAATIPIGAQRVVVSTDSRVRQNVASVALIGSQSPTRGHAAPLLPAHATANAPRTTSDGRPAARVSTPAPTVQRRAVAPATVQRRVEPLGFRASSATPKAPAHEAPTPMETKASVHERPAATATKTVAHKRPTVIMNGPHAAARHSIAPADGVVVVRPVRATSSAVLLVPFRSSAALTSNARLDPRSGGLAPQVLDTRSVP